MNQANDPPATGRLLKRPLILVGCPRSGTTLLGRLFAAHPDVAYWEEPRTVWSTGNQHLPDDLLGEKHLTPKIAAEIDQRFGDFLNQSGRTRFVEKTPSNMLRLPFIHALYPDCKIIHIYRDPRPVISSALCLLASPPNLNRITSRVREAKLHDLPGLAALFFRDVFTRFLSSGKKPFWGPRPPGWREWQGLPPATMLSKQWCALIKTAQHDLQVLPAGSWMEIRYEDLLTGHSRILVELLTFAELEPSSEVAHLANEIIQPERANAWRQTLPPDLRQAIEMETGDWLTCLGYPL